MIWILIAFMAPAIHGFANILDNYLTNKLFKNVYSLVFYLSILNIIFIPLIFLIQKPDIPPAYLLPFIFLIGLIDVVYLFPYYKALQNEDTSVVTLMFSLGKIFIPVLAFLVVGEVLHFTQYLGFLIIILASSFATFSNKSKFRFNKSFFYMVLCTFLLAIEAVIYKYIFENTSWSTGFISSAIFSFLIVLFFLFIPKFQNKISKDRASFNKNISVLMFVGLLSFLGSAVAVYVISLVPVTIAKTIGSFQSFFVLIYAIILHKFFPNIFKENIDRKSILKKLLLFIIMVFGVILVIR